MSKKEPQPQLQVPHEIHRERWKSVKWAIQQVRKRIDAESDRLPDWVESALLSELLSRLESFAEGAMQWMYDSHNEPPLHADGDSLALIYSPNHARYLITQQATRDLAVIWHVYSQRQGIGMRLDETLAIIKQEVENALQPAIRMGYVRLPIQVVPYFQNETRIRIIPYANVAFIGVPFWMLRLQPDPITLRKTLAQDLLSIPHEVGHFVYWYGRKRVVANEIAPYRSIAEPGFGAHGLGPEREVALVRLMKRFVQQFDREDPAIHRQVLRLHRWSEEIFADAYGVVVAGKASAASAISMLEDGFQRSRLFELDDEHPAAIIRPEVSFSALTTLNGSSNAFVDALRKSWEDHPVIRSALALKDEMAPFGPPAGHAQPGKGEKGSPIEQMSLAEQIQELGKWAATLFEQPPAAPAAAKNNVEKVSSNPADQALDAWERGVTSLNKSSQLSMEISWEDWLSNVRGEYDFLNLSPYAQLGNDVERNWVVAINAGGWTDGPQTGGVTP